MVDIGRRQSIETVNFTDGAFAIAIGFLNHDLAAHPSYTSRILS